MKDFFKGIQWLFEEILFAPYNWLRELQYDSWFWANIFNWIFILVGAAAFIYWMLQLKEFGSEDKYDYRRGNTQDNLK